MPVLHTQKHAGTYRRALPSGSLGQAGIEKPGADCLQWSGAKKKMAKRGWYGKSALALLRKGEGRLWTNIFVRERLPPFLKPRPTDAFRTILLFKIPLPTTSFGTGFSVYDCRQRAGGQEALRVCQLRFPGANGRKKRGARNSHSPC